MSVVSNVDGQVLASLHRAGYADRDVTLLVGVSGGADSTTLLHSLHRLSRSHRISLHVAHLNHDFRGDEADEDARFVESLAQKLGLPVTVEKRDPIAYQRDRGISSFEQGAREMRYEFMARVAEKAGAVAVAVGHTADDLAETVLLHILRGSGLPGLRGMTEVAPWPWPTGLESPALFRPMLEVNKADTVEYCRELGQDFRLDSGNFLFRFTRNRVRQNLMPYLAAEYNPRVREALVRLARTSALELDYLEGEMNRAWPGLLIAPENAANSASDRILIFDRAALSELHPALRRLVLRRGYVALAGDSRRLRESHLRAMSDLSEGRASARTLDLPNGLKLESAGDRLTLYGGNEEILGADALTEGEYELSLTLPVAPGEENTMLLAGWRVAAQVLNGHELANLPDFQSGDNFTAYLDLNALGDPKQVRVRTRRPGDRFQPLGMSGVKKLQDFLTDAKAPRSRRDRIPLLVGDTGIAWVVGYRIADWAKVKPNSTPDTLILRLKFERQT